jgi:hypothetical protein
MLKYLYWPAFGRFRIQTNILFSRSLTMPHVDEQPYDVPASPTAFPDSSFEAKWDRTHSGLLITVGSQEDMPYGFYRQADGTLLVHHCILKDIYLDPNTLKIVRRG